MTLHETLAAARARLADAGISPDEAAVDVEVYAGAILGWDRARLLTELRAPQPAGLEPRFSEWVARRLQREPTAYILGRKEFWGREFSVSSAVLIPRPETELIVEEALRILGPPEGGHHDRHHDADSVGVSGFAVRHSPGEVGSRTLRVADVGTGSGCIGISIAADAPSVRVVATDISREALDVARDNASRLGVRDRMEFAHTSYLDGVDGPFDVIVSNPPYVKDSDKAALSHQVRGYEPHVALFGGAEGLDAVTAVLDAATNKLTSGGWLVFEFGLGQDDRIETLVAQYHDLTLERLRTDLQGIPRTAVVRKAQSPNPKTQI